MKQSYGPETRMRDLIDDNKLLLLMIGRFGIPLGFGDDSIAAVCSRLGVDATTFLTVANFISGHAFVASDIELAALMGYLRRAHSYYLDFLLPSIGKKLVDVIGHRGGDEVSGLLMKYYDEYVDEVRRHMQFENDTVFAYVESLMDGRQSDSVNFAECAPPHTDMTAKLRDLKDIIIRYYPQKNVDTLNSVLLDLITCEQDLISHCRVEDCLLVPNVRKLEASLRCGAASPRASATAEPTLEEKLLQLTQREKEVVRCVAMGMANKEIANALCLSVHTVTTYRHSISVKLGIHSPSGLTIFAIINKLVDIDDIKRTL